MVYTGGQKKTGEPILSFNLHVGPGYQTQVARLTWQVLCSWYKNQSLLGVEGLTDPLNACIASQTLGNGWSLLLLIIKTLGKICLGVDIIKYTGSSKTK